jgi:hypothetical protein
VVRMVYRLFGGVKRADVPEGFVEIPCEIEPGLLCREPGLLGNQTGNLGKPTGDSGRELEGTPSRLVYTQRERWSRRLNPEPPARPRAIPDLEGFAVPFINE